MKKLMLLVGILSTFNLILAQNYIGTPSMDGKTVETNIDVSIEVMAPLKVETDEVKFGKVAQGATRNNPVAPGKIKIKGAVGEVVKVELKHGTSGEVNLFTNAGSSFIGLDGKTEDKSSIKYYVNVTNSEKNNVTGDSVTLTGGDSWNEFNVGGKVVVSEDAEIKTYSTTMDLKVTHISYPE